MTQFQQWFAMGGYSAYVWSAYGLVFAVLLMNFVITKMRGSRVRKKLQQGIKRQAL